MVRVASLYSLEPFDFDSSHILNFAHPQFCGSHFTQPRLAWFAFKRLALEVLRPSLMAAQRMKDTLAFLTTLKAAAADGSSSFQEAHRKILESCLVDLKDLNLSMPDATSILRDVQAAEIPMWMKDGIVECVQQKVANGSVNGSGPVKKVAHNALQKNLHLQHYLTAEEWEILQGKQGCNVKILALCKRFVALGLTCPSELTSVLAISLLLLASHQGAPENLTVDGMQVYHMLQDFKSAVKNCSKSRKRSELLLYPPCPQELPEALFKAAYPAGQVPVKNPLGEWALKALAADLPARNTRTVVRGTRHAPSPTCTGNVGSQVLSMSEQMLAGQAPQKQLGLTYLTNKRKQPLAIMNGPAEVEASPAPSPSPEPTKPKSEDTPQIKETIPVEVTLPKTVEAMAASVRAQLQHNKGSGKLPHRRPKWPRRPRRRPQRPRAKSQRPAPSQPAVSALCLSQAPKLRNPFTIVGSPSMCARNRSISGQNEMARRKTRHSHGKHLSRQRPGQTYWSMSPLRRQRLALRQESAIWKHAWGILSTTGRGRPWLHCRPQNGGLTS